MGLFNFNESERNVVSAYAKLTGISLIAGIAMGLGGYGVLYLGEKLDDKRNLERARDALKEQLDNQKDLSEKYKQMYYSEERANSETYKKFIQLQIDNRRLEEKLEKINSSKATEGLGD